RSPCLAQETTVASFARSARGRPDGRCIMARYRSIEARKAAGFKLCTLRMLKTLPARRTALSYSVLSSPAASPGSMVLIQATVVLQDSEALECEQREPPLLS